MLHPLPAIMLMTSDYYNPHVDLFLDERYLSHGITKLISWNIEQASHCLICGQSGSGKTYSANILLTQLSMATHCELFLCDFKSDTDFDYLDRAPRFFRYLDCRNGLNSFYDRFLKRQNGTDKERHPLVLFYDEWSSFCNAGEKRRLKNIKRNWVFWYPSDVLSTVM